MSTSNALQQNSQKTAVSLSERYKEVKTIAQAFQLQEKPLAKLDGDVKGSVKLHLAALARFLNLKNTLTEEHIEFISEKIISDQDYKWIKPADLKIFFNRIKMGHYGDFYGNLNSISFFQSLDKYMSERSDEIERIRIKESKMFRFDNNNVKLPYFVNSQGRLEFTEEKKRQDAALQKLQEYANAESYRKQVLALQSSSYTEEEKKRIKEIMDEWEMDYTEAVRMFKKEQQKTQ